MSQLEAFDRINHWVSEPPSQNERHLWVVDRKTKEITWKSRKVYSSWQWRESGRIKEIFREMLDQLPSSDLIAENKDQYSLLLKLKNKVDTKYERYFDAHRSFFGFFYLIFFGIFIGNIYSDLDKKLAKSLKDSIQKIKISSFTPSEIDSIAKMIKDKSLDQLKLNIDWKELSKDQFKAAYALEKLAEKPITLDALDKEKMTYFLEQDKDRIKKLTCEEIEQHIGVIAPHFLAKIIKFQKINVSHFNLEQIKDILKNGDKTSFDLKTLDPSDWNAMEFGNLLKEYPLLLEALPSKVIAAFFDKIHPRDYNKLTHSQLKEMDFSQFSEDQFINIYVSKEYLIPTENEKQVDLSHFSLEHIKVILKGKYIAHFDFTTIDPFKWNSFEFEQLVKESPKILGVLSPKFIVAYFDKIHPTHYKELEYSHWKEIDFSKLSGDQFTHILKNVPSKSMPTTKFNQINLGHFNSNHMKEILKSEFKYEYTYQMDFSKITPSQWSSLEFADLLNAYPLPLNKLSPQVIAAHFDKIPPGKYHQLSYHSLEEVDFSQFSGNQFVKLLEAVSVISSKNIEQLDLNRFTAANIKEILAKKDLLHNFNPQTISANITKFEPKMLSNLFIAQIKELDVSQMTVAQIVEVDSFYFTEKQWLCVDLSKFSAASFLLLHGKNPYFLSKLTPATVAANFSKIPTKIYYHLTDPQLKEIDFLSLDETQKAAFSDYDMSKMKNGPKPKKGWKWFEDDYWDNFFKSHYGNTQIPNDDEKLKTYVSIYTEAVKEINKINTPHLNSAYENLRQKCLTKENELKKDCKLIFVDEATHFDVNNLKQLHKKLALAVHPDKNNDRSEEATELFKLINEAYQILKA